MKNIVQQILSGDVITVGGKHKVAIPAIAHGQPSIGHVFDITNVASIAVERIDDQDNLINPEHIKVAPPFPNCMFWFKWGNSEYASCVSVDAGCLRCSVLVGGNGATGAYSGPAVMVGIVRLYFDDKFGITEPPGETVNNLSTWGKYVSFRYLKDANPQRDECPVGADLMDFERRRSGCIEECEQAVSKVSAVLMLSFALLNCKNVHAKERPFSTKLAKRYHERHGHKLPKYYVLDIEPMKQVIRKESGGESVTLAKALHICRGHFKNFDDKPLFGRLKGTYWWQPHVRGAAESGVVDKDYRIKLPKEGQ